MVGILPEETAVKAAAVGGVVEGLLTAKGEEQVIHILRELGALANGEFRECLSSPRGCQAMESKMVGSHLES